MGENKVRFVFALSSEGTKKWQEGVLTLNSGGLRNLDGSMYEMATPICFDSDSISQNSKLTSEEAFQKQLTKTMSQMDLTMRDISALKDIAWLNYAINYRTYETSYFGFQRLIRQLDNISVQLTRIEQKIDNKEFNDRIELADKYRNNLKSFAGFMEINSFNATDKFLSVSAVLDEIGAYFERLHNELKTGTGDYQIALASIVFLLAPYAYVVCRYSARFYYENGCYPPNYEYWFEVVSKIARDARVKNKLQYYLRVNTDCSLEDAFIARDKILFNLRMCTDKIRIDHLYTLQHSKEEYLSISKQQQTKIDHGDFQIIDGHLLIEI